jgi:hypothetical protein
MWQITVKLAVFALHDMSVTYLTCGSNQLIAIAYARRIRNIEALEFFSIVLSQSALAK